ncbi:tripartite tricarboxylate transporter TctB family protein [Wenxinia marina]|uniref:Tripartite tricarboxylate transporter TctB family n=1 Tax=Wenxinia marina DSM 24838 TaxID=1123501 RepID=A0A0D0NIZ7_9RHOB|nr:tripartite tricarboxylate transporter TctB family protein [Wenxinia marina]KIQ68295.1 Tripartite tricarboxylate transporter TctB family [Wenxinia marina DSM 24838]GGL79514.1 hypothetical protein GCM10011392_37450 [Wenxinia marina]
MRNLNKIDVLAGLFVLVIAALSLFEASGLAMGSARSMGPGYFPFYIGLIMVVIGIALILQGRRPVEEAPEFGNLPSARSILLVLAAVTSFALMIERFGLVPATAVAVFLGTLADRESSLLQKLILTIVVPVVCVLIFKIGLSMSVDVFRWRP